MLNHAIAHHEQTKHGSRKHAGTQARRHAGTHAHTHTGTQARRHAGTQARTHPQTHKTNRITTHREEHAVHVQSLPTEPQTPPLVRRLSHACPTSIPRLSRACPTPIHACPTPVQTVPGLSHGIFFRAEHECTNRRRARAFLFALNINSPIEDASGRFFSPGT